MMPRTVHRNPRLGQCQMMSVGKVTNRKRIQRPVAQNQRNEMWIRGLREITVYLRFGCPPLLTRSFEAVVERLVHLQDHGQDQLPVDNTSHQLE